jgi:hypothetical protein
MTPAPQSGAWEVYKHKPKSLNPEPKTRKPQTLKPESYTLNHKT